MAPARHHEHEAPPPRQLAWRRVASSHLPLPSPGSYGHLYAHLCSLWGKERDRQPADGKNTKDELDGVELWSGGARYGASVLAEPWAQGIEARGSRALRIEHQSAPTGCQARRRGGEGAAVLGVSVVMGRAAPQWSSPVRQRMRIVRAAARGREGNNLDLFFSVRQCDTAPRVKLLGRRPWP
jgi:hypothetical protein